MISLKRRSGGADKGNSTTTLFPVQNSVNRFRTGAKKIIPKSLVPLVNKVYFSVISIYYRGGAKYCPCCDSKVKAFLPYAAYSEIPRPNAQCPVCGSLERHRMVWHFLQHRTRGLTDRIRLLHFAPEDMIQRKLRKCSRADYLSADLYARNAMLRVDIHDIPLAAGSHDAIICLHVIAHIRSDRKALSELFRVLKPGGWLILQTHVEEDIPLTIEYDNMDTPQKRREAYGNADFFRVYGRDFVERVRKAGFVVQEIRYARELGAEEAARFGLSHEPIYFCIKPTDLS